MIVPTRLRKGSTSSPRGAARLVADSLVTATNVGVTGSVTVRADSAYYGHAVVAAARHGGARFSVTARMDPAVTRAITQIPADAWTAIKYRRAIFDQDEGRWVSEAQVATAKAAERAVVLAAARSRNPERFTTTQDPKILAIPTTPPGSTSQPTTPASS